MGEILLTTLALDNETFLITRERPAPIVVSTAVTDGDYVKLMTNGPELEQWFHDALDDLEINFVGHNIAYDFMTAAATWPSLLTPIFDAYGIGRITDTGIRQQLFDIAMGRVFSGDKVRSYSLGNLYEKIFDEKLPNKGSVLDDPDNPRYNYGKLYGVPVEEWPYESIKYAKDDAVYTWRVWNEQNKVAHLLRDDPFQAYVAFCLSLISVHGMRTDPIQVERFRDDMTTKMKDLEPELIAAGLLVWDKRKGGFVKKQNVARARIAASCDAIGVKALETDKGQISIDKASCYWAQDELMIKRANYSTYEKMLSTYVAFLEQGSRLPITTRFHLVATGRTSSSGPSKPLVGGNFQNMPRMEGPRECIVPRAGKVFLAGDFSGAELHALAQVCKYKLGYSALGDALLAGTDVHLLVAAQSLGIPYDDAVSRYNADDKEVSKARQDAKPANFGFGGGMGVKTFIRTRLKEGEVWTEPQTLALKRAWLNAFPEMVEYFEVCNKELGPKGSAIVEFYYSKRMRKIRGFPTMCNGWFQALTADGAKMAIAEVIYRCYADPRSYLYGCRPTNFVHDELILEIPDNPAVWTNIVEEFSTTMEEEFNLVVPDYPTKVDAVLMRRWSKHAKPVTDADGNLIPWG